MGFFKNLFSGNFKEIAHQAVKNISSGHLIKGGGIIGDIINQGANVASGGLLTKIGNAHLTTPTNNPRQSIIKPLPPDKVNYNATTAKAKEFGDVNVNGSNFTIYLIVGFIAYYLIKKR